MVPQLEMVRGDDTIWTFGASFDLNFFFPGSLTEVRSLFN